MFNEGVILLHLALYLELLGPAGSWVSTAASSGDETTQPGSLRIISGR